MGQRARAAGRKLARATTEQKNAALYTIADTLEANSDSILAANQQDLADGRANGLTDALLDRLSLQGKRLAGIVSDVRQVAKLPDPVGEVIESSVLPNGLAISKRRTPLGVLGVIYEARPNVTVDVATLAFKTGNAAIMRGGSETLRSNTELVRVIRQALEGCDLPADSIQLIGSTDRRYVGELLKLHDYVDMIIPRGGEGLHRFCRENSTIPVITGGIGICHLYVDTSADQAAAVEVIHNAKTQRPSVCNALDTILVKDDIAAGFIPRVIERLGASGVTFRLDPKAWDVLGQPTSDSRLQPAGPNDWDTEWLSLILSVKIVSGLDEAIDHIQAHSTAHSDGILTRDEANATRFVDEIDSAAVYVNASTRFTDGGQFGLGAEVAVSTQKMHARGPMGLRELTTYKWIVYGDYHVRP
ncbi:MAG: glutamate-5-semialdehyde dehydrogenase [Anaerolineae bacterium]|nr:glutamate-5-semialdehyde dehydrogenase [Anaerolineae bacterium]